MTTEVIHDAETKGSQAIRDETRATARGGPANLNHEFKVNGFMLITAAVLTFFGLLVVVPPMVNHQLAPYWSWATPYTVVIVFLLLSMLALVGLWHQQRYLLFIGERLEQSRVEVEARAKKRMVRLYALLDASRIMAEDEGLEDAYDHIAETCSEVFNCDQVSFMSFCAESEQLVVRAVSGPLADRTLLGAQQKLGHGIAGWAAERREPLLLEQGCDSSAYPGLELHSPNITAAMVVPIILNSVLVGIINVSTLSRGVDYDRDDFRALQVFAENVGSCIRHAQKQDEMRDTIRELKAALHAGETDGAIAVANPKPDDS